MIFGNETLRNQFNLKIFMDTDDDIRLSRRGKNKKNNKSFII